ncbi:hypothetical protein PS423_09735 [Pediococcus acidilactici]|uniref:hypothetical protein n=1 Tax=Pediococcus acidilactici TaxID=1254 RepID=UPI002F26B055
MIKVYRKTATIKAEQFDGSQKMIEEYHINTDVQYSNFNSIGLMETVNIPFELSMSDKNYELNVGDWIVMDTVNGFDVIADDIFRKTYEEVME